MNHHLARKRNLNSCKYILDSVSGHISKPWISRGRGNRDGKWDKIMYLFFCLFVFSCLFVLVLYLACLNIVVANDCYFSVFQF